jgi:hypothetical protein
MPEEKRIQIVLKSGKDQSVRRFHPWVFSGAIKKNTWWRACRRRCGGSV